VNQAQSGENGRHGCVVRGSESTLKSALASMFHGQVGRRRTRCCLPTPCEGVDPWNDESRQCLAVVLCTILQALIS
jgi:hypothetical protein